MIKQTFWKLFYSAFLVSFLFSTPVYAVARAPFPSAASLQPIPASEAAKPNISGNVQTTGTVPSVYNTSSDDTASNNSSNDNTGDVSSDQSPESNTVPTSQGNILIFLGVVLLVLAAGGAYLLFRKDSSEDTV